MACILYMLWPVKCLSFSRIAFHFCKRACSRCLSKRCMISNCPTVAKMYRFPTTRSLTGSHLSSGTHRWENGFQSWWGVQHFAGSFATIESCVVSFEIGCFFSVKSELFVKSHDLLAAPRPSRWCEWLSDVNRQWWWLLLEAENCRCHDLHPDLRCHMKRRNLNGRRSPQNAPEFAGQVQLLRELLQRNASCIQREPISGCTALHLAARNGEEEKCVRKSDRSDRSGPVSKLFS